MQCFYACNPFQFHFDKYCERFNFLGGFLHNAAIKSDKLKACMSLYIEQFYNQRGNITP
jgi:hypothetical protein